MLNYQTKWKKSLMVVSKLTFKRDFLSLNWNKLDCLKSFATNLRNHLSFQTRKRTNRFKNPMFLYSTEHWWEMIVWGLLISSSLELTIFPTTKIPDNLWKKMTPFKKTESFWQKEDNLEDMINVKLSIRLIIQQLCWMRFRIIPPLIDLIMNLTILESHPFYQSKIWALNSKITSKDTDHQSLSLQNNPANIKKEINRLHFQEKQMVLIETVKACKNISRKWMRKRKPSKFVSLILAKIIMIVWLFKIYQKF